MAVGQALLAVSYGGLLAAANSRFPSCNVSLTRACATLLFCLPSRLPCELLHGASLRVRPRPPVVPRL